MNLEVERKHIKWYNATVIITEETPYYEKIVVKNQVGNMRRKLEIQTGMLDGLRLMANTDQAPWSTGYGPSKLSTRYFWLSPPCINFHSIMHFNGFYTILKPAKLPMQSNVKMAQRALLKDQLLTPLLLSKMCLINPTELSNAQDSSLFWQNC